MADQSLTLRVTVRNQGSEPSDPTTLRYYRSTDSTITSEDIEVGTDRVASLTALGSSAESVLTHAPSTPGAYYYGACVDPASGESDATDNCSAATAATVSEFDIESLPWVNDGITGDEWEAMEHVRALAQVDRPMSQRVAGSQWLSDGISEDELRVLADLRGLAHTHPDIAVLTTTTPDQTGSLTEDVLSSLLWMIDDEPSRSEQLLSRPWFRDGLTEEEAALLVVLRDAAAFEDVFRDLLQDGHVRSETISLPLAGEVDLFAVSRTEVGLDDALERIGAAVEPMEGFMGVPWPKSDVIMLHEPISDLGRPTHSGWYSGTHMVVKNTSKGLIYHETAHYYLHSGPKWLIEGGANFLRSYVLVPTELDLVYFDMQVGIVQECAP